MHDDVFYHASKLGTAACLVEADIVTDTGSSKQTKIVCSALRLVLKICNMHRNREVACTVPTQPQIAYLSLDKSEVSEINLTCPE
jgi:hypothetical protein